MKDTLIHYAAILANLGMILFSFYIIAFEGYGRDASIALLLLIPPLLSLAAIRFAPDLEERKLERQVRKARLRKELQSLDKSA